MTEASRVAEWSEDQLQRRKNLLALIDYFGTDVALRKKIGLISASQLSHLKKTKPMGEAIARDIEKALGLAKGWMERDHSNNTDLLKPDADLLSRVCSIIQEIQGAARDAKLAEDKIFSIVETVYLASKQSGDVDRALVTRLIKLTE